MEINQSNQLKIQKNIQNKYEKDIRAETDKKNKNIQQLRKNSEKEIA